MSVSSEQYYLMWKLLLACCCLSPVLSFTKVYRPIRQVPLAGDPGEPLFLTPLIEAGNISEAIQRARVGPFPGDLGVLSYAGYLTVNKTYNSNLFFWFFPAETDSPTAPLLWWIQGGPGATSLYGIFTENGPYRVADNLTLIRREYSWTTKYNMLYIDSPVGTGFSFTEDDRGYLTNEEDVGRYLYDALMQFYQLFPDLQDNDFYLTGESYGGKYIPAMAYTIHTQNPTADLKVNLKGLAIGNGFIDPINQLNYADYLYQVGLLDNNDGNYIRLLQDACIQYIQEGNYTAAKYGWDELFLEQIVGITGFTWYYNYLFEKPINEGPFDIFVQQEEIRSQLHVGNLTFHTPEKVIEYMTEDFMKSVKPWFELLLDNYRTMLYSGQIDIIVPYPSTENFLQTTQWSAANEFKNATRYQWKVGDDLAGYTKTGGNLTLVLVRNAGHIVPEDQPEYAFDMINRFVSNLLFHD